MAAAIAQTGIATVTYHAGMSPDARASSQAAFMEGGAEVVVATNAFGMGVDKADVRTVAHWALPTSLEAYYQEAGQRRARRSARARAAARLAHGSGPADQVHQGARHERRGRQALRRRACARAPPEGEAPCDRTRRARLSASECCSRSPSAPARSSSSPAARRSAGDAHRPAAARAGPMPRSRPRGIAAGSPTARSSATAPTARPAAGARSSTTSATRAGRADGPLL